MAALGKRQKADLDALAMGTAYFPMYFDKSEQTWKSIVRGASKPKKKAKKMRYVLRIASYYYFWFRMLSCLLARDDMVFTLFNYVFFTLYN